MFGYTGKTYLNGVGILRWYATRKDNTVLITTRDHRKIIITPDQPDEFVEVFSKNLSLNCVCYFCNSSKYNCD